jgi:lipopolysaccharide/colanic/teichoic acid biosynthesis glycosyltransferase
MKRAFDIVVGTILAVLVVPVILVAAMGTALALRAWPFFVQDRVGRHGRTFRCVKIRTLPTSAPRYADKYTIGSLKTPAFSQLLRLRKIDELPQLFLVPLGRMSLVGPRPEMPTLHGSLDRRFAESRTSVRPGCTGLWQISNARHQLIGEAPEFDEFYLRHASLRLDLWLIVQTLRSLVGGAPISLDAVPRWAMRVERQPSFATDVAFTDLTDMGLQVFEAAEAS